jgi:hypothetical protein
VGAEQRGASAKRPDWWIFVCFLVLLVWAPLPLSSKPRWASSILETGLFALAMAWLTLYALNLARVPRPFQRAWPALVLFGCWLLVLCAQVLPVPQAVIAALSHGSVEAGREANHGCSLWARRGHFGGSGCVLEFLSRSLAYAGAFGLTLVWSAGIGCGRWRSC